MTEQRSGRVEAFIYVTTLFFAWGFATAMIDPLVAAVRSVFKLSFTESLLTQFVFFTAYFVISLPAAFIVARIGFTKAIVVALLGMVLGCMVMPLTAVFNSYAVVLAALFILASGITLLQVAANPLAAALGSPSLSHFRLTLSQTFNSLGTTIAPMVGASLLLKGGLFVKGAVLDDAARRVSLNNVGGSFVWVAVALALLALVMWLVRGRIERVAPPVDSQDVSPLRAFSSGWALFGSAAIFLYVGAEVSIGSVIINFLSQPTVLGITALEAGNLLSFYWGGAMVGRLIGSVLLTKVRAGILLTTVTTIAALLCVTVMIAAGAAQHGAVAPVLSIGGFAPSPGVVAAIAVLSIGLFNSIMFPTIFTLTLDNSSAPTPATSGLLCMAIVGGAILPLCLGAVADRLGLSYGFIVPLIAYIAIAVFAVLAARGERSKAGAPTVAARH